MTPELLPQYFPNGNPHLFKSQHVRTADAIVCVSQTTRSDLLSIFPEVEDRTFVTPLATGGVFSADVHDIRSVGKQFPYVVFVGGRGSYKSFDTLRDAVSIARQRGYDIGLLLVGGGPVGVEEARSFSDRGIPLDRWEHRVPTDEALASLYRDSLLLAYPSLYEGFGMPVLDAMSSGTLVVTSDAPALVEVGGGYASVHKRGDRDALAEMIVSIVDLSDSERQVRIRAGKDYARSYSWVETARKTAEAYSAASGHGVLIRRAEEPS